MLVNIAIGVGIFGYAGWALFRFVKKSKEGQCGSCATRKNCQTACGSTFEIKKWPPSEDGGKTNL
jgi:positive regulator of sigma E activity